MPLTVLCVWNHSNAPVKAHRPGSISTDPSSFIKRKLTLTDRRVCMYVARILWRSVIDGLDGHSFIVMLRLYKPNQLKSQDKQTNRHARQQSSDYYIVLLRQNVCLLARAYTFTFTHTHCAFLCLRANTTRPWSQWPSVPIC